MAPERLAAADTLHVVVDEDAVRVEFHGLDWFGAGRFAVDGARQGLVVGARATATDALGRYTAVDVAITEGVVASVRAYAEISLVVFRLESVVALDGIGSGDFAVPTHAWPWFDPAQRRTPMPDGARGFGFQYTEFAWPTQSDASLKRWRLLPFRPSVVEPLGLVAEDGHCVLLGPLNAFHDQIISVVDGVACGWHGDLDCVPQGFATELAVVGGTGPRDCLDTFASLVHALNGTRRPSRDADDLGRSLSYWTDNGSAYWYRTEAEASTVETLASTVADLRERAVPVRSVQLDSWWYPHEVVRPFNTDEWVVPPTGLVRWEARDDVLPEGVHALRAALGDPPLVAHCRHLSSRSPYLDEHACWVDGDRAHPQTADLYERWLDQAQAWGVATFEHDWLVESFLGVRALRSHPGRARSWQEGIDRAASQRGITLQWCMATPADFLQTTTLRSLTSIRTSGDHGYMLGPGELWAWFLINNAFARGLGLRPYKDVFLSDRSNPEHHAEVEALLAALSTGPVGIGDARGRADREIVLRTCRADGVLVRPDVPVAAIDRCFALHPVARRLPLVAEAWTDHPAGRWTYAVALNVSRFDEPLAEEFALAALGAAAPHDAVAQWDWRTRSVTRVDATSSWTIALDPLDWDLVVLAPIGACDLAVVGDPTRYATAGDTRLARVDYASDRARFTVLGAGEAVPVVGWAARPPRGARAWTPAGGWTDVVVTSRDELWSIEVAVPPIGWCTVEVIA